MRETLRFKSSCIRAGDVLSADEQVMLDINRNPKRIRAVCEQVLDLLGARGHIVAASGAQLGDGIMQIDVEIRLARESLEIDEKAYWCAVRRMLRISASEAEQEGLAQPARPEASGDGRHAVPADRPVDPNETVPPTSSPPLRGGEVDREGVSRHEYPDPQSHPLEDATAPQSPTDSDDEGRPSTPKRPKGPADGVEHSGSQQAVSVYPDGRTPGAHAASGGQENGEPTELDDRPQTLLLGQEPVNGPGVQVENAPAILQGADEPLGERGLEQHVAGNWTREPGAPDPLVDPPSLMLQPPVAQVEVVCIERQIVRLVRLRGWRSPEALITTDPNEDPVAVGDNLSERLFGLPVMSRGLYKLGKFWVEPEAAGG